MERNRAQPGRNPLVDAVRIFACLWVVMFHWQGNGGFFPRLLTAPQIALSPVQMQVGREGFLGVELFFILSGLVIAKSVNGRTPRQFLTARLARLYPSYLAASLLVLAVIPYSIATTRDEWYENTLSFFWLQFPLHLKYFLGAAWSLEFEIYFYLSVALMILLCNRLRLERSRLVRRSLVWSALVVSASYFATQTRLCALGCSVLEPLSFFLSLGGFAPYFILGAMISRMGKAMLWRSDMAMLFISACLALYEVLARIGFSRLMNNWLSISMFIAAVVVLVLGQILALNYRPAVFASLRLGALLTYPIYLLHETFGLSLISLMLRAGVSAGTAYLAAGAAVLAASLVLVTRVDKWITQRISHPRIST